MTAPSFGRVPGAPGTAFWTCSASRSTPERSLPSTQRAEATSPSAAPAPRSTWCSAFPASSSTAPRILDRSSSRAPWPNDKATGQERRAGDYGVFKNQGDCVSFVATGGKEPAGQEAGLEGVARTLTPARPAGVGHAVHRALDSAEWSPMRGSGCRSLSPVVGCTGPFCLAVWPAQGLRRRLLVTGEFNRPSHRVALARRRGPQRSQRRAARRGTVSWHFGGGSGLTWEWPRYLSLGGRKTAITGSPGTERFFGRKRQGAGLVRIFDGGGTDSRQDTFEWAATGGEPGGPDITGPTTCAVYPAAFTSCLRGPCP